MYRKEKYFQIYNKVPKKKKRKKETHQAPFEGVLGRSPQGVLTIMMPWNQVLHSRMSGQEQVGCGSGTRPLTPRTEITY